MSISGRVSNILYFTLCFPVKDTVCSLRAGLESVFLHLEPNIAPTLWMLEWMGGWRRSGVLFWEEMWLSHRAAQAAVTHSPSCGVWQVTLLPDGWRSIVRLKWSVFSWFVSYGPTICYKVYVTPWKTHHMMSSGTTQGIKLYDHNYINTGRSIGEMHSRKYCKTLTNCCILLELFFSSLFLIFVM